MSTSKLYFGGRPTGPDVRKLLEAFADRPLGSEVTYTEIEKLLGEARNTSRFNTVVTSWRKALFKQKNVATVREAKTESVRLLREDERVIDAVGGFNRGRRQIGRSVVRISAIRTEILEEGEREKTLHAMRLAQGAWSAVCGVAKEIASVFSPPAQIPRGGPPEPRK